MVSTNYKIKYNNGKIQWSDEEWCKDTENEPHSNPETTTSLQKKMIIK